MKTKSTKSRSGKAAAEQTVKNIHRATRKLYGAEEKIRIVLEGLRDECSIAPKTKNELRGMLRNAFNELAMSAPHTPQRLNALASIENIHQTLGMI